MDWFKQLLSATIYLQMGSIISFVNSVKVELTKVTWPKRDEVIRLTLIVFAVSAIIGGFVGGFDYIFTKLLAFVVTK